MKHGITIDKIYISGDNNEALKAMFIDDKISCTKSSFNIIQMIQHQSRVPPLIWKKQFVDRHQDKKKKYKDLDDWGKANIQADALAKCYMVTHPTVPPYDHPSAGWTIYQGKHLMVADTTLLDTYTITVWLHQYDNFGQPRTIYTTSNTAMMKVCRY